MATQEQNNEQKLAELLSAYLDGELTPDEMEKVETLLAENVGVRKFLEQLRQVSGVVSGLPKVGPPDDLVEQIQYQLEREMLLGKSADRSEAAGRNHLRWRRFAAAAAMLVLVGAVGAIVYSVLFRPAPPVPHDEPIILAKKQPLTEKAADQVAMSEAARSAAPVETVVDKVTPPVYSSVYLAVVSDDVIAAQAVLEKILADQKLDAIRRTDSDTRERRISFLCRSEQLQTLSGILLETPGQAVELLVNDENTGGEVVIADPTLEQVMAVAGETDVKARYALALQFIRPTLSLDQPDWLERAIAKGEPQLRDLHPLGPKQIESAQPGGDQMPVVANQVLPKGPTAVHPGPVKGKDQAESTAPNEASYLVAVTITFKDNVSE